MFFENYLGSLEHEIYYSVYYYHNAYQNCELYTIGCELSEWDGEKIMELCAKSPEPIIILNTCSVTDLTELASKKLAQRLKDMYPNNKIYIVGCGVDYDEKYYQKYGICLKNSDKFFSQKYGCSAYAETNKFAHNIQTHEGLVKIQDGCHNNCSFCCIKNLRSHPYSLTYTDIKHQIQRCLNDGKTTINLVGTEVCFYKCPETHMMLSDMVENLLVEFPSIQQLKIGSMDPASPQIEKIIDLMKKYSNMSRILLLSAQSGCDSILKAMNRRHTAQRLRDIANYAKGICYINWHIIVGFPGETKENFLETLDLIKELNINDIDVLKYSPRNGTVAALMKQTVSYNEKIEREKSILRLLETQHSEQKSNKAYISLKENQKISDRMLYYPECIFTNDKITFSSNMIENNLMCIQADLYDYGTFIQVFKWLQSLNCTDCQHIIFLVQYKKDGDIRDLELNEKILTFNFQVKIVLEVLLDTDIDTIMFNELSLRESIVYYNHYVRFLPTDNQKYIFNFLSYLKNNPDIYKIDWLLQDIKKSNIVNKNEILRKIKYYQDKRV